MRQIFFRFNERIGRVTTVAKLLLPILTVFKFQWPLQDVPVARVLVHLLIKPIVCKVFLEVIQPNALYISLNEPGSIVTLWKVEIISIEGDFVIDGVV